MLSMQATITLTASTDPTGVSVTLDDLLQFVAAVKNLEEVHSIELHAGELVAMGTAAPVVQSTAPRQIVTINSVPAQRVAVDR